MSFQWPGGFTLRWFSPDEFDHPTEVDVRLLQVLDEIRHLSGVPIKVTSDFRTDADMERIYGPDRSSWPNSPHQRGTAVDFRPVKRSFENFMRVLRAVLNVWNDGAIPKMGMELGRTGSQLSHFHLDMNDPELRRPHFWIGKSR